MAAQYPAGIKSFAAIVDGVDYPQATHVNQVYDEVTAIETQLLTPGSWTPVLGGDGGTSGQTYSAQTGASIKFGRLVVAHFVLTLSAKGTITGNVIITGLPATSAANPCGSVTIGYFGALATNWIQLTGYVNPSATTAYITGAQAAAAASAFLVAGDIGNATTMRGTVIYMAAA